MRPAFAADGTITAGNSSSISDEAASVVLTTRAWTEQHGIEPLALIGLAGQVANPDTFLNIQPASTITAAVDWAG